MNDDFVQRRRVAVAAALTVILVPAAFLLNRDPGEPAPPQATLVGTVQVGDAAAAPSDSAAGTASTSSRATDPMGSTPVAYLDGTLPPQADDPATIAIPRPAESIAVTASFSNDINDPKRCQVRDVTVVPFNAQVTVKNLDNSRTVQCIASIGGVPPDDGIVLNADAFMQIGDLTDAPLSVEITW